jgi:integrase
MVVRLYNKQREAGYSASTIKNTSLRLTALLDAAVEHHYIAVNPAKGIRLAKPEPRTRSLTVDEVKVVLGATHHYHNGLIYHLLLYLGLRKGEALGLRWQDLDWEAGVIRVHQQIQEIEGRVVVVPSLKTKASVRALPLPGVLIELLRSHQQQQEEERQIVGPDWKEYDLIFASEVGTPVAPTNVNRQWTLLRKRAGTPPITIHELRHTCATLLGEQGVEERVIGALLGHETQTITGRYAHVTMAMKQAAVERLVALYDA